jgi:predicted O-methyltransferase YrrM
VAVETLAVEYLHEALGFREPLAFPDQWRRRSLVEWSMEPDDCVLRYIFRNFRPLRHLEFGTWLGDGVLRCVEECDATVWTINLLEGEQTPAGGWAYAVRREEFGSQPGWLETLKTHDTEWVRTDAYGAVGRKYLAAGWGRRVCQVYCDSREWDTQAYPDGFFDTAFIDGGHDKDIVCHDTACATRLVRAGGLVIWHDFCPDPDVSAACASTAGPNAFVAERLAKLTEDFDRLFWIEPSWLLVGIRR